MAECYIKAERQIGILDRQLLGDTIRVAVKTDNGGKVMFHVNKSDVVEVVRCKECKHLGIKDLIFGYCKHKVVGEVKPYDFCSYGERKEQK